MYGWLFNTLQHRLDAEEREWHSFNRTRGELEPNILRRFVLRLASMPFLVGGIIFGVVSLLDLMVAVNDSKHWVVLYVACLEITDPVAYFSALWSIQAAIAALVYPIVIAFVTLLVERRNNSKAALHIYLHDSAALLAGLSAIFLIAAMTMQYAGVPYLSSGTLIVWVALDATWFMINIVLTTHFLLRTFEFIKPGPRFEITRRYAVSVAWPQEARYYLARHLFLTSVEANLLPGPTYGTLNEGEPSVFPGYIGLKGVSAVTCIHLKKRQLRDIRFLLLELVTKSWLKRANAAYSQYPKGKKLGEHGAVIAFPLDPFAIYEGNTILCKVEGEITLSWFERLLIRFSFVFRVSNEGIIDLTVNDILMDAQAEAIASLRSGEPEAFEENVMRMIILYESLLDASQVKDASGGNTSLMLVADRSHLFNRPIYEVWSRRFFDLFEVASNKLSQGEDYVSFLTHVPNRLFSSAKGKAVPEILKYFIALSPILLRRIEGWWVRMVEQQGQFEHGPSKSVVLSPPFHGVHDKVLREFVGAWEQLKNDHILPERDEKVDWQDLQQSAEYLEAHLSHTLVMLFDCILRGDRNATEWLADVLVKWYGELQFRFDGIHGYLIHDQPLLSIEMMLNDWDEVESRVQVESFGFPSTSKPLAILAACLSNLWVDTCCIAIYLLGLWSKDSNCDKSLPVQILSTLVKGRPLRHDGHGVGGNRPYDNADGLLIAIFRQYYVDGYYRRRYRNRLDKYVERIADLSQSEMVSGRIYSWTGSNDLNSVRDGQLLALMLAVSAEWKPNREIEEIISEWSIPANEKVRIFQHMLGEWKKRITDASFLDNTESYNRLSKALERNIEFESARLILDHAIDHLLDVTARIHMQALTAASISEKRLIEIGQWASEKAFTKETASFPVYLFDEILTVNEPLNEKYLKINGKKKGELTDPPMADMVSNDEEWFAETLGKHTSSVVISSVIDELNPEIINADTPEQYWSILSDYLTNSKENGHHPILLLENPMIPYWLYNWIYPRFMDPDRSIPANFVKSRDESLKCDEYICNINNVPVFNTPIPSGASILIVQESLERIEFSRQPDGRYVNVETKKVEGHPELVDLMLSWKMRTTIKQYPSICLNYGEKGLHSREEELQGK